MHRARITQKNGDEYVTMYRARMVQENEYVTRVRRYKERF